MEFYCTLHSRIPKQILEESLGGRRLAGRPRNRWKDKGRKEEKQLNNTNQSAVARHGTDGGRKRVRPRLGKGPKGHKKFKK
jgi:hypothetical protein